MRLGDFLSPEAGQKRTKWLNEKADKAAGTLDYFLGPTGVPDKLKGIASALQYTDAGDYQAAAEASQNLWNNPSVAAAGDYATAGAALAMPFVGAKMMTEGVDAATDIARGARDSDTLNAIFPGYHGTSRQFDEFDVNAPTSSGVQSPATWFSSSENVAQGYGPRVVRANVDIEDGLEFDFGGRSRHWFDGKERTPSELARRVAEINEDLKAGYSIPEELEQELLDLNWDTLSGLDYIDGLILRNVDDSMQPFGGEVADNYAVFSPSQIAQQPETPAAQVARLLREGRGDEVTDDLMAQADPQEMWRLYDTGATGQAMPMDTPSRMARAEEMGFDTETPLYHGGRDNLQNVSRLEGNAEGGAGTFYMTDERSVANSYAPNRTNPSGENITPLLARSGDYREAGYTRPFPADGTQQQMEAWLLGNDAYNERMSGEGIKSAVYNQQINAARRNNQPGVVMRQTVDNRIDSRSALPSDVFIALDPTNIRSRFARFDPRLAHLRNLSAAGVPLGLALGISPEDERELRDYLQ